MADEQRRREEAERERDALRRELFALTEPRESPQTVEEAPERAEPNSVLQERLRKAYSAARGGVGGSADEAERLRREDVSEASANESRPSGMERKLLIRPLPAELFSETMLQLGGGNDVDLGDYIEEDYLSDWRVVSHTIDFRPEGSHLLTVLVERPR